MAFILVLFPKNDVLIKLLALFVRFCLCLVYNEKNALFGTELHFGKKLVCFRLYIGNESKMCYVLLSVEIVFLVIY